MAKVWPWRLVAWGLLLLRLLAVTAVILKGKPPKHFPLKNSSTIFPLRRFRESSLSRLDVDLPMLQRSYTLPSLTTLIPLKVVSSLVNLSDSNTFGILFGHRIQGTGGTEVHVHGISEFQYPIALSHLNSQINESVAYLSRVTSLEPVGCLFPNPSTANSSLEVLAGLALSNLSHHPEEFLFVKVDGPPSKWKHGTVSQVVGLSAHRYDPLAFNLMKSGLIDFSNVTMGLELSSVMTTREISINEGAPTKTIDAVLLTTPVAINQSQYPPQQTIPCHIFPSLQALKDQNPQRITYLTQLLSSSLSSPEELVRWYDLNLLLFLREEVDEPLLTQLINILKQNESGKFRRNEAILLLRTIEVYLLAN